MKIDFDEMENVVNEGFKGGEKYVTLNTFSDGGTKIMRGVLGAGASIGYHMHEDNSEIIYVISGTASVLYDRKEIIVEAGCAHYCPKGHSHSLRNHKSEDLVFFAVVQ